MYTQKQRDYYNIQRENTCKSLGITVNQYNWLRRKGEALHKIYEQNCNGELTESDYEKTSNHFEREARVYAESLGLKIFFQSDPRGATIYLDTKEIPYNNYNKAHCIY